MSLSLSTLMFAIYGLYLSTTYVHGYVFNIYTLLSTLGYFPTTSSHTLVIDNINLHYAIIQLKSYEGEEHDMISGYVFQLFLCQLVRWFNMVDTEKCGISLIKLVGRYRTVCISLTSLVGKGSVNQLGHTGS